MLDAQAKPPKPRAAATHPLDQIIRKLDATPAWRAYAPASRIPDRAQFIRLWPGWASQLELDAARQVRRQPFTWRDYELMCRTMLSCLDLEDAILRAADFCCAVQRGAQLALQRRGDRAVFVMDSKSDTASLAGSLTDVFGLLSFRRLFSWLIGEPLAVKLVRLPDRAREKAAPFTELFEAPVVVGQACPGLEFDAAQLSQAVVRGPAELQEILAYPLFCPEPEDGPAQISRRIGVLLDQALTEGRGAPVLGEIASRLGLSEATLRRRLRAERTSYQVLKTQSQLRLAEHQLRHTDQPVADIARRLGFSNAASLRRAFRRWTGRTPGALRR